MEKAKQAVKDITHRAGHHTTDVTEHTAPAVTQEHVTPTRHENQQTVVDKEVHQDHHHTTVQPVHDKEVLPEKHSHNLVGTENREYRHGDESATRERIATEAAQFKNTSTTGSTQHTSSTTPTVGGEHVHHHVHETIQPVVNKETIQPSVVHTTVPIHETHHNEAKHHSTSALPAVSMADFKKQGGTLTGRADRTDHFEGEPRTETATQHGSHSGSHHHGVGETAGLGATGAGAGLGSHNTHGTHGTSSTTAGPHSSNLANKADPRVDSDHGGSRGLGSSTTGTTGTTGTHSSGLGSGTTGYGSTGTHSSNAGPHGTTGNKLDPRVDSDRDGSNTLGRDTTTGTHGSHSTGLGSGTTGTTGTGVGSSGYHGTSNADSANQRDFGHVDKKEPSLIDKLNPMKDSNGDGTKGFMK